MMSVLIRGLCLPKRVCHLDSELKAEDPVISTEAEGEMERSIQNRFLRFVPTCIGTPVGMTV